MTCIGPAPTTLDEWLAIIDRCATAAGGPGWAKTAILGAEALLLMIAASLLLVALVRSGR